MQFISEEIPKIELEIGAAVLELAALLKERGLCVSAAESLTCGMISSSFADVAGCSKWFSHGFVTYSDEAKADLLGVDPALIKKHTAVSAEVGLEMARCALKRSGADFAIAVTGLAGPGPDELGRDAGLVYIAVAFSGGQAVREFHFDGNRTLIRKKTNRAAVLMLKRMVQNLS
ncbi:MAG: CinA family protein [Christensenellaceae bacterium]|nr:CinA family protein [Christensenellaceae bacterium]